MLDLRELLIKIGFLGPLGGKLRIELLQLLLELRLHCRNAFVFILDLVLLIRYLSLLIRDLKGQLLSFLLFFCLEMGHVLLQFLTVLLYFLDLVLLRVE